MTVAESNVLRSGVESKLLFVLTMNEACTTVRLRMNFHAFFDKE